MYLQSITHAVPEAAFTQQECWEALQVSDALKHLSTRSRSLLENVLLGDSRIEKRHFATDAIDRLFSLDAASLNQNFEAAAPALAERALSKALTKAGLRADAIDALFICTCTGYLCPGLTSYVSERLALPQQAYLQDIVGLGCGAAIPTLRSAQGFLATEPDSNVACVAVEICSSAFYLDDDPGVLISACLFGDGAAATIWSNDPRSTGYRVDGFDTIHAPEHREILRFTNAGGKLRNKLHRSVPQVAAPVVRQLHERSGVGPDAAVAAHVGGRDVLTALETVLPSVSLAPSWEILRQYGNVSSPSVLFALEALLEDKPAPDTVWLTSFGAGFAAHSCALTRDS